MRKRITRIKKTKKIIVIPLLCALLLCTFVEFTVPDAGYVYANEILDVPEEEPDCQWESDGSTESYEENIGDTVTENDETDEAEDENSGTGDDETDVDAEESSVDYDNVTDFGDYRIIAEGNGDYVDGEPVFNYMFYADDKETVMSVCRELGATFDSFEAGVAEISLRNEIPENTFVGGIEIFPNRVYEYDFDEELCNREVNNRAPGTYSHIDADGSMSSLQWHRDVLELDNAWRYSKGKNVKVAVIDSGIDYNHPALKPNISKSLCAITDDEFEKYQLNNADSKAYDSQGHGTHVAGIVAATMNNDYGISGVAPQAKIISIKVYEYGTRTVSGSPKTGYFGLAAWAIRAINMAVAENVDIINMSLSQGETVTNELNQALKNAYDAGIIVVCAAGNRSYSSTTGTYKYTPITSPASSQYTYAIAAGTRSGDSIVRASFSRYGTGMDFILPGDTILSTNRGGGVINNSGTSMASPVAAGIFALLKSKAPEKSASELYELLKESAIDIGDSGYDEYCGYGMPRPLYALRALNGEDPNSPLPTPTPTPNPTPSPVPGDDPVPPYGDPSGGDNPGSDNNSGGEDSSGGDSDSGSTNGSDDNSSSGSIDAYMGNLLQNGQDNILTPYKKKKDGSGSEKETLIGKYPEDNKKGRDTIDDSDELRLENDDKGIVDNSKDSAAKSGADGQITDSDPSGQNNSGEEYTGENSDKNSQSAASGPNGFFDKIRTLFNKKTGNSINLLQLIWIVPIIAFMLFLFFFIKKKEKDEEDKK